MRTTAGLARSLARYLTLIVVLMFGAWAGCADSGTGNNNGSTDTAGGDTGDDDAGGDSGDDDDTGDDDDAGDDDATGDDDDTTPDDTGNDDDPPALDLEPGDTNTNCSLDRDGFDFGDQRIIIQSVNFQDDVVVIRNVSGARIVTSTDSDKAQPSWRIYVRNAASGFNLPANFPMEAGDRIRIHLRGDGSNDANNIYMNLTETSGDLFPATGGTIANSGQEFAVLSPHDGSGDVTAQEAFVRWGTDTAIGPSATLRDTAAEAGVWIGNEDGDFVITFESSLGITLSPDADVTDPADWRTQDDTDCL